MAAIEPAGLPAVRLAAAAASCARATTLSDDDMVRVQRANLLDPMAPNPSVELLLHAFLPHKFVDHTHATAVLSLIDQPDGAKLCEEVYGGRMGFVPYVLPGFGLAKAAADGVRAAIRRSRADPRQARHLHLRRERARILRAHDRDGHARRGAAAEEPQGGVRDRAAAAAGRRRATTSRRSCAAPAASRTTAAKARTGG